MGLPKDFASVEAALEAEGWAVLPGVLDPAACGSLAARYDGEGFRSRVVMQRHGFGQGEYKYFDHPLPAEVTALRRGLYAGLAPLATRWQARLGLPAEFPPRHEEYLARCHAAGQRKPTPLLLRYEAGDYNCLHQDLYGALAFPFQATLLLSRPGLDFTGGEFVLTEQRPRMQSRAQVVPLGQGDAVVFAVNARPQRGKRGDYRVTMRHGVSRVTGGRRHTLGVILHDAA